jgi:type I restriction enzyme M protein
MITGDIRNQVDTIWNSFWTGGISNPLEVIEQITYLLFLRRLDDLHTVEELKATRLNKPMERRVFPEGADAKGKPYDEMRWSRFKNTEARAMFETISEHVFPWLRTLGGNGSTYARHMKDARFTIPTPQLLAKVVDLIARVPMEDRDTKGDLYEYMLSKIASAGQNGQFRTPRHIIRLMVEMTEPQPKDIICDPACGTGGFLVAAGEYLREHHPEMLRDDKLRKHFHETLFHGFDFDNTMLRIGSMNMLLHGVENSAIIYRDSLAQDHAGEIEKYTLVLANPPFAGSLDYESAAKDLLGGQNEEDRAAVPCPVPSSLETRWPCGRNRAGRCAVRLFKGAQGAASDAGRATQARCHHQVALRRVPALCGRLDRDPDLHQDQ